MLKDLRFTTFTPYQRPQEWKLFNTIIDFVQKTKNDNIFYVADIRDLKKDVFLPNEKISLEGTFFRLANEKHWTGYFTNKNNTKKSLLEDYIFDKQRNQVRFKINDVFLDAMINPRDAIRLDLETSLLIHNNYDALFYELFLEKMKFNFKKREFTITDKEILERFNLINHDGELSFPIEQIIGDFILPVLKNLMLISEYDFKARLSFEDAEFKGIDITIKYVW